MRAFLDISNNLKSLEHVIRLKYIKSVLNGYGCKGTDRKLFTLPVKHGGLSVYNPTERCQIEFENSRLVTQTGRKSQKPRRNL